MTIAVIGAGASGMMAALTAAEQPENKILLFERQARVGRKLAVTGNGRCNLTNTGAAPENYHGAQPDFAAPALAAFPPEAALRWFAADNPAKAHFLTCRCWTPPWFPWAGLFQTC